MSDCPGPRQAPSGSVWIWPVLPPGLSGTLGSEKAPFHLPFRDALCTQLPVAVPKACTMDSSNSRNSHSSGGQKSEIQVLAGLFLLGGQVIPGPLPAAGAPWLQASPLSPMTFPSMSVCTFPLLLKMPVIEFRGHPTPA